MIAVYIHHTPYTIYIMTQILINHTTQRKLDLVARLNELSPRFAVSLDGEDITVTPIYYYLAPTFYAFVGRVAEILIAGSRVSVDGFVELSVEPDISFRGDDTRVAVFSPQWDGFDFGKAHLASSIQLVK